MSSLQTNNLSLSSFAQFAQNVTVNNHQTTEVYQIVTLNSKCKIPKTKCKKNISETVGNIVPENQESGRNWQRIGSSKDTAIVSRQCSLTTKSEHIQTIDESFHLFIDDEVINNIILHTNKKANECIPPEKQWKRWIVWKSTPS
ncbi:hypothetical protein K0M31_007151 [Melipona bicolor]|uniref:Uncharacterized protein n=1 Tax=Melipona bicolor TaxID=60889 RepID=A0AA40FSL9_9HYME|nr:hypothetical protein K0M31_007151 [Melipona bicolor]